MEKNKYLENLRMAFSVALPVIIFGQFFVVQMLSQNIFNNNTSDDLSLVFIKNLRTVILLGDVATLIGLVGGAAYLVYAIATLVKIYNNYKKENPDDKETLSIFLLIRVLVSRKARHLVNYLDRANEVRYRVRIKLLSYTLTMLITLPLLIIFTMFTLFVSKTTPFTNLKLATETVTNYEKGNFQEIEVYIVEDTKLSIAKLLNSEIYLNSTMRYIKIIASNIDTKKDITLALPIETDFDSRGNVMSEDINYYLNMFNNNAEIAQKRLEAGIEYNKDKDRPKTKYKIIYAEGLNVVKSIQKI